MRYLKAGEIVRDTDEVYVADGHGVGVWCIESLNTGKKLPKDKEGLYRRRKIPLKPAPDLLTKLKAVLPKVKNGMQSQTIHNIRGVIADCIDLLQPDLKKPCPLKNGKVTPGDYEYCPHCKGSFSFASLGKNFICKWCHKDVRKSKRMA